MIQLWTLDDTLGDFTLCSCGRYFLPMEDALVIILCFASGTLTLLRLVVQQSGSTTMKKYVRALERFSVAVELLLTLPVFGWEVLVSDESNA